MKPDPTAWHGFLRVLAPSGPCGHPPGRAGPWRLVCTAASRKWCWDTLLQDHGQDEGVSLCVVHRGEVPDPQRSRTT